VVCPYEAVSLGELAAHIAPVLNEVPLYEVGGYTVCLPKLLLGLSLVMVLTILNIGGVRLSATAQQVLTFGLLAVFFAFTALGLTRGDWSNLRPAFADGDDLTAGLVSISRVLQIVPY